jgi:hypothetical protein
LKELAKFGPDGCRKSYAEIVDVINAQFGYTGVQAITIDQVKHRLGYLHEKEAAEKLYHDEGIYYF